MDKTRMTHPVFKSPLLSRLLAGNLELKRLERRVPQLLPNRQFRSELDMEILRSDRTALTLTLLLFGLHRPEERETVPARALLERLARVICEATRKTDLKGWFCDSEGIRAGLILFNTPPENAQRIIANIRARFQAGADEAGGVRPAAADPVCEIYSYPPFGIEGGIGRRAPAPTHEIGAPAEPGNGHADPEAGPAADGAPPPARQAALPPGAGHSIVELLTDPMPLWKRALDVSGSLTALILLSPLLALIALAVKLSSPGPVIFKQERIGYRGRKFMFLKFRSMRADADPTAHKRYLQSLIGQSARVQSEDEERPMIKLDKKNPQITAVGRLLRITSMDELPQFWNVLRGDMSLVGPRPCLPYEAEEYLCWHTRRLDTVPGITGLWQVKGKNRVSFRKMIMLDILYSRQRSLWLDLKILLQTVPAVLREIRDGLHPAK